MKRNYNVKVFDGFSNRSYVAWKTTYDSVTSMCRSLYPPGYIWSVEPV